VQDAIQHIKKERQQCNVKSILGHLKLHHSDNKLVGTMNERDLMNQLELGVKDGILSRKFRSNQATSSAATPSSSSTASSSPAKTVVRAVTNLPAPSGNEIRLPNLDHATSDKDKRDLNIILQLQMKAIALLTKQSFAEIKSQVKSPRNEDQEPCWCTITDICSYLMQQHKFRMSDGGSDANAVYQSLMRIVFHLANKQEKIFLKQSTNGDQSAPIVADNCKIRLNSVYIQEKLQTTSAAIASAASQSAKQTTAVSSQQDNNTPVKGIFFHSSIFKMF
jgi:hypothetical protein